MDALTHSMYVKECFRTYKRLYNAFYTRTYCELRNTKLGNVRIQA